MLTRKRKRYIGIQHDKNKRKKAETIKRTGQERTNPQNKKSSRTTGSIIKWIFIVYVTLYIVAAASIIIYSNYNYKETIQGRASPKGIKNSEYKILMKRKHKMKENKNR
jgi:hypothetical protein